MTRVILAINAGSSSIKVTFFALQKPFKSILTASVSGIGATPELKIEGDSQKHEETLSDNPPQAARDAFEILLNRCFDNDGVKISSLLQREDISFACHRIVHGGEYEAPIEINEQNLHHLEALEDLAPLHNIQALEIVRFCQKKLPKTRQIAHFDTCFHKTLPDYVKAYAIDQKIAKEKGLRKYGFHGISYAFILRSVAEYLDKPANKVNLIAAHLGSGASVCAIKDGKSIDTSMGLTPLEGLPGATRSGHIDPSLVFHYVKDTAQPNEKFHTSKAELVLNKECGWKALSGTADFSELTSPSASEQHKLAFDIFVDRLVGYIGQYYVKLDGHVDAIVFAGGIGEKSAALRSAVVDKCKCLGFALDQSRNEKGVQANGPEKPVVELSSTQASKTRPKVLICQTDEQFEMALTCTDFE